MEPSHIFPVFTPNGSTWSPRQDPSEVARGCPLGPLTVIYYSVLLCLGLPGRRCMAHSECARMCWSLHHCFARVTLCILICLALVFNTVSCCSAAPECHKHILLICHPDLVAVCHACIHTLYVFVSACACLECFTYFFLLLIYKNFFPSFQYIRKATIKCAEYHYTEHFLTQS